MILEKILLTPSSRAPQESGALRYRHTFTPHYHPVLHSSSGHEVYSGPSMSVLGIQLSLCDRLPIVKLFQQGPYPDSPTWG